MSKGYERTAHGRKGGREEGKRDGRTREGKG